MKLPALALLCALLTPPSGRPPVGPLERFEPRVYDVTFDVTLKTWFQIRAENTQAYRLQDAPIVMPVIFNGAYSAVKPDSLAAGLWLEGTPDPGVVQRLRLDDGFPFNTQMAVIPVARFTGHSVRWALSWRVQVWSSRLKSEQQAASVTWPRQWPDEVADGLRPQKFIESDDPFFARAVEQVSGGKLRLVPPYVAAKEIVRHCVTTIRVNGDGENRGNLGALRGMELVGARGAAGAGIGSPHDLVCICVAMLRAAGIPARPVVGIQEKRGRRGRNAEFVSWAEFYLPKVGWVPFDPVEMTPGAIRTGDILRPWGEFGTVEELNERIPLAYHFMPPAAVETPMPAVWGWDPRPGNDPGSEPHIRLQILSRGRGQEDPR